MKTIASILIVSMVILGLNRFMEAMDWIVPTTELCSDTDYICCSDQCCEDDQESKGQEEKEQQCSGGCDCSYSIQIVAINQHLPHPGEMAPRTFEHAFYCINYQNEYFSPHFQPPRMA